MAQPGMVAPWRATYVPGEWYLIAGPTSLVVLEPGAGRADMIADLWADVVASASMSDLVDRLAGYGITELPDLAVLFWSQAGMRTLVRGAVSIVDAGSGRPIATGAGIITWNEVDLGGLTRVRVALGNQVPDGNLLPLAVGVVRVGAISLSADDEAVVRSPQPLLRRAARPAGQVGPTGEGVGQPQAAETEAAALAAEPGAGSGAGDDTGPDFPAVDAEENERAQTGESPVVALDSPWGPQADEQRRGGAAGSGGAAGVASAGAGAGAAGAGAAGAGTSGGGTAGATAGGLAGGSAGVAHGPTGGEVTPPQYSLDQFAIENDDTQMMSSSSDGAGVGPESRVPSGPRIEAVHCPNGHPNAPTSAISRVCRAPIPPGPPQLIPPPLLARLRAADGTLVDLDRAILFGRAPSEQRSTVPLPRLVALASPAQDISRTHLQVVPDNWQVVATDLNSTNGTYVTDPGPNANGGLLPPGRPTPVPIGATLELGEGVTITVEAGD